jgi:hypothetical protein
MATCWTGNSCQAPGFYESDCSCARVIRLGAGEDFPPCAECLQMVTWELLAPATNESRQTGR